MKTINIAAAALLVLGLSTAGFGKCNGMQQGKMQGGMMQQQGSMMMTGDMQHDKSMMMQHLDNIKTCVDNAKTSQELNACNMQMRKGGPMMQKGNMPMNGQMMQNGEMPMNNGTDK